jgi:hypothetical protein
VVKLVNQKVIDFIDYPDFIDYQFQSVIGITDYQKHPDIIGYLDITDITDITGYPDYLLMVIDFIVLTGYLVIKYLSLLFFRVRHQILLPFIF